MSGRCRIGWCHYLKKKSWSMRMVWSLGCWVESYILVTNILQVSFLLSHSYLSRTQALGLHTCVTRASGTYQNSNAKVTDASVRVCFVVPGVSNCATGGFCGYRNIQMLISYMNGVRFTGSATFRGNIPSIFSLQDYIENAWDLGINAQGRVETGGVRGTRKYIGTPEV